ncbi:MAG: PAS domain-containing protein [Burkholderiaceae bacterium]
MPYPRSPVGQRLLVLAPTGHDADNVCNLLSGNGIDVRVMRSLAELARAIDPSTGAVLVTTEALQDRDLTPLAAVLDAQPTWSDVPFVYLAHSKTHDHLAPPSTTARQMLPRRASNVIVLERPLSSESLLSAVVWALSARSRQFELCDQLLELERRAELLREAQRVQRIESERLELALSAGAIAGTWVWQVRDDRLTGDERFARTLGLDPQRLARGMPLREAIASIHPDDVGEVMQAIETLCEHGGSFRSEHRVADGRGGWRWLEANGRIEFDTPGQGPRFPGVLIDISERKQIELSLQRSESELRLVTNALPVLIALVDGDGIVRFVNEASHQWLFVPPDAALARSIHLTVPPVQADAMRVPIARALDGQNEQFQLNWPHADGRRREAEVRLLPRRNARGEPDGLHLFVLDVTDRQYVEEVLRESQAVLEARVDERTAALKAEMMQRQRAEDALRQAQKMEAVGQLTGGIAHDFNNLLQGISGSLALIKKRLATGRIDQIERFADNALQSAARAAALTHRLLAFSRRQPLDPKPMQVNPLIRSMEELLRRTLGETVTLELRLDEQAWPTVCDGNQLENALLNLAINARDAMPGGGKLVIATSNETRHEDGERPRDAPDAPHRYVCIAVTDTGIGMPASVVERAFDPFFTTKPQGQGTGLGLSMIYGFTRQSEGLCEIDSEVGLGTTVRLYLPHRQDEPGDAGDDAGAGSPGADDAASPGRKETILVIEDDDVVRELLVQALSELSFDVLQASDGPQGLDILRGRQRIDLLLSDIGLPGLNGRQVADAARVQRPNLKVLFMTGYAEVAATANGFLRPGMALIAKPFAIEVLTARVCELIDSEQAQESAAADAS